jgi:hypothetical protein
VRLYLHQTEVEVLKAELDRILADTNNRADGLISLRINPQPDLSGRSAITSSSVIPTIWPAQFYHSTPTPKLSSATSKT